MSPLTLHNLRWETVDLPLAAPFLTSSARYTTRRVLLLHATVEYGGDDRAATGLATGLGEAAPLVGRTPEAVDDITAFLDGLSLPLTLSSPQAIDEIIPPQAQLPTLRFAFELAITDALSSPLPYRPVPMQWTVSAEDLDETLRRCRRGHLLGFTAFKLKVGAGDFDSDLARIKAVRRLFPDALLRLDANGAFTLDEARDFLRAVAPLHIDFIEEPVAGINALRTLATNSPVDVAADESCASFEQATSLIDTADIPVLIIKPMAIGGLLRTKTLVERAHQKGLRVVLSSLIESSVARDAIAQLASTLPELKGPQGLATEFWFHQGGVSSQKPNPRRRQNPLFEQAQKQPDAPAFTFENRRYSYAELSTEVQRRAAALSARGIGQDSVVGLLARNSDQWIFTAHALFWLGATLLPLHPDLPSEDLKNRIENADLDLLIDDTELNALAEAPSATITPMPQSLDQVLTLFYTSGTTGTPSLVRLTLANHLAAAEASRKRLGHHREDCWLNCLPLFHIGGLAIVLRSALVGASFLLLRRFESSPLLEILKQESVTIASFVPTMVHRLLADADADAETIDSNLRFALVGGGPISADELREARRRGLPLIPTYGMTEAASQVATLSIDEAEDRLDSAGRPLPGVEISILDPDANPLPPGQSGRIFVQGPMVTSPGHLLTKDVGYLDAEGYLYLQHRHGERIVSGGENVDPGRVEALLRRHPDVDDVALIGLDDPEWGQIVAALISPGQASPQKLFRYCRDLMAPFEIPRVWAIVDEIPRTLSGKLHRQSARRLAIHAQQIAQPATQQ